jgi:hypothetical protein
MLNRIIHLSGPFILTVLGCFLPYASYNVNAESYNLSLSTNYNGDVVLLIISIYTLSIWKFNKTEQKNLSLLHALTGIFILGFTLLRLYQTLTIFKTGQEGTLSESIQATAYPREGIFPLLISGTWLILRALRRKN